MAELKPEQLAEAIMRYLDSHPSAADSLTGIVTWWLPRELSSASVDDVQAALNRLIADHRITRSVLPGGTELFGRMQSPNPKRDADG